MVVLASLCSARSDDQASEPTVPTALADEWELLGEAINEPGWDIWGSSPIITDDGKVHLFVARWPANKPWESGWRFHSQIARYIADSPEGPFRFQEVVLRGNGQGWDARGYHNPNIRKVGDRFALTCIANDGKGRHGPNQRIGIWVADKICGPWKPAQPDPSKPMLSPPDDPDIWCHQSGCGVNNPALLPMPDGTFHLYFKARPGPKGHTRMGLAIADRVEGPYVIQPQPVTGNDRVIEDGYAFHWCGRVCLMTTDNHGMLERGGGLLWVSKDDKHFDKPLPGFHKLDTHYFPGGVPEIAKPHYTLQVKCERPQLLVIGGEPAYLYAPCGVALDGSDGTNCYLFRRKVSCMYVPKEEHAVSPGNMTYYIDPVEGKDTHSGQRKNLAWRTFGPINRLLLSPGDRLEITSPGSFDQTLVLMGAGTVEAPIEIHFAPGRYDFYPAEALKRKYQISNANDAPDSGKAIGILLEGARHFNLSGSDASLFYRGKMIEVCIDGCENISILDLCFDYHRPTVSEFRAASIGADYVDLEIHRDSSYRIENGNITWTGEGWSYGTGLAQELDLASNEIWRREDPLKGMQLEEVRPYLVRARGNHNMKTGRVYQIRNTFRDCAGAFIRRSEDITWTNVKFNFMHGLGVVSQFSENLTLDRISIAPAKENGRTCAAWADCLHFSGCRGKILVKNCLFSGSHDDTINIHGTHLRVVERISDKQIKVRFMHPQTFGFMAFNPGDDITFVEWDSLKTYAPNRIRDAHLLNPKEMLLTLETSVPAELRENDVVENVTWTPEVEIRGCQVYRTPTRGFLVTTRRKVLVVDNEFFSTRMSAILIENDAEGWFESGCVRNMTIRNNRFVRCGEPVVSINPHNRVANDSAHQNIRIENNEFVLRGNLSIMAKSTNSLILTNNLIYSNQLSNEASTIKTSNCSQVHMKGNKTLPFHD